MGEGVDDEVERVILATDEDAVGKTFDHAHYRASGAPSVDRSRRFGHRLLQARDRLAQGVHQQLDEELVVVLAEKRIRRRRLAQHSHQQLVALVSLESLTSKVMEVLHPKRGAQNAVELWQGR